ncbi:MAG: alpha/beta fold hydrolase [Microbacteriaceae bacterium]|nr:alpha/beta fold hydrolase [Microbacteriaceae bacterium]
MAENGSKSKSTREDSSYLDEQGVRIHCYAWRVSKPKAVVQIVHGLGEHALRYEWLAAQLNRAGYSVFADDHRGHGATGMEQTGGDITRLGKLGPGGLRAAIASVHEYSTQIKKQNPGLPLVLLGHSWGSLIAQILLNKFSRDYTVAILSGSAYRTLRHMNGGDLNAKHRKLGDPDYEWISRDKSVVKAAAADPLMFVARGLKLFGLADSLRLLGKPSKTLERDIPLLILSGSDDSFGGERSVELLANSYLKRSGLTDVTVIVYKDARHEVFNETNKQEVVTDTIAWLADRLT